MELELLFLIIFFILFFFKLLIKYSFIINYIIKRKLLNLFFILNHFLLILFFIFYNIFNYFINYNNNKYIINNYYSNYKDNAHFNKFNYLHYDNYNYNFAIIQCKKCSHCGLFCLFKFFLYSTSIYLNKGYVPIIDLSSFPNIYNGFNKYIKNNPWEDLFNQPFGYTLEGVKKNAKRIKYFECYFPRDTVNHTTFYMNQFLIDFYHNIALKYIPIKNSIIKKVNLITYKLFKKTNNILGILQRGTDYVSIKPKSHPIPPRNDIIFQDIIEMDKKNKYDFYFLATEDDLNTCLYRNNKFNLV